MTNHAEIGRGANAQKPLHSLFDSSLKYTPRWLEEVGSWFLAEGSWIREMVEAFINVWLGSCCLACHPPLVTRARFSSA